MAANIQDVFMVFGDSITQGGWASDYNGFGQQLSHVYARKLDVLNRGLSGYNTEWAMPIFEKCLAEPTDLSVPKIRVLTIWFGANDAVIESSPQHVSLARFTENLTRMVDMVTSSASKWYSPHTRVVLLSPPPVNTFQRRADLESRTPPQEMDREFARTREFAEAVGRVADAKNVAFVDVWSVLWVAAGKKEEDLSAFLSDGLHLSKDGYQLMYAKLMKTILEVYPDVHPDNLNFTFVPWTECIKTD